MQLAVSFCSFFYRCSQCTYNGLTVLIVPRHSLPPSNIVHCRLTTANTAAGILDAPWYAASLYDVLELLHCSVVQQPAYYCGTVLCTGQAHGSYSFAQMCAGDWVVSSYVLMAGALRILRTALLRLGRFVQLVAAAACWHRVLVQGW